MQKNWEDKELYDSLTALLFVGGVPTEATILADVLGVAEDRLASCADEGNKSEFSNVFFIQKNNSFLQLATKPPYAELVNKFLQQDKEELSPPAKETLAVIAYEQPINRAEIEAIRGFDSRRVLHKLTQRGLIQHATTPADGDPRAYYYEVSLKFLEHFGLASLDDLRKKVLPNSN